MSKRRVLLTHYDLDGMGCDILLSNMFDITKKHRYGYGKIKKCIESGELLKYDSVLVTDVSLTQEQFKVLHDKYGEAFLYVDHHLPSLEMIDEYDIKILKPTMYLDDTMSATGIIMTNMSKYLRVHKDKLEPLCTLASYIDSYDMWRNKTHPLTFKKGYDLNIIFWKLGFNNFFYKFKNGFREFDSDDRKHIKEYEDEKHASFKFSEMFPFNGSSLFVYGTESKYVNDYPLSFPEYDIFYIVYMYDDMPRLGLRTTRTDVKLGHIVKRMVGTNDCIMTAGGHPQAAGVDFIKDTSLNLITLIAEQIDEEIRNGKTE